MLFVFIRILRSIVDFTTFSRLFAIHIVFACIFLHLLEFSPVMAQAQNGQAQNSQIPQKPALRLHSETQSCVVGHEMEYLEDPHNSISFEQIRTETSLQWLPAPADKPSFGFTSSSYWFRFKVQNLEPKRGDWLLELDYPPLDTVVVYLSKSRIHAELGAGSINKDAETSELEWSKIVVGDHFVFSKRLYPARNFVFPLSLNDADVHWIYLKVRTESSLQVPLTLYRPKEYSRANTEIDVFYGCIFGALLTLILLNIVLYFTMKVPSYLSFVLYLLSTAGYYAATAGYSQFLLGDYPLLVNTSTLVAVFMTFGSLSVFGRAFLQTFRFAPFLDTIHRGIAWFGYVGAIGAMFLPYRPVARIGAIFVLVCSLLCCVSSVGVWRKGQRSAAYFLVAIGAFVIGAVVTSFRNIGIFPSNTFTVHSVEIASAIEGVLFSFGLAGQYRLLKKQKEEAQKEALELQKQANTRLEEKVVQRTKALAESNDEIQRQLSILDEQSREIELANSTLQEKNLQLEELNREKNEFLGIAAHDLKNPLSSITMSASIVLSYRDKITEEQLQDRLENIMSTSKRMMEIIKNLLDVNAIESGQFNFTVEPVNLAEITGNIVEDYRERAEAKNIRLQYSQETADAKLMVMGDKSALMEALENLVSNAVKYSPKGKNVFIRLKTKAGTMKQDTGEISSFLRVEVADEGPGISPDDMKKLFGKFVRLTARPTDGEDSTGLGLSIVKKMVEAMNGKVWCESELGNGATFIVEFPKV